MEKYGFVYIWRDRKHNRYYVGSHWGREDDGYICSSRWMRESYRRRPDDFKRRIIERVYTNRAALFTAEERWLQQIKAEEIRTRYYNLIRTTHHWATNEEKSKSIKERLSEKTKQIHRNRTDEEKLAISKKRSKSLKKVNQTTNLIERRIAATSKTCSQRDNYKWYEPKTKKGTLEYSEMRRQQALKGWDLTKEQREERIEKSRNKQKGKSRSSSRLPWWTDGTNNIRQLDSPGENWYRGRTQKSAQFTEEERLNRSIRAKQKKGLKQSDATRAKRSASIKSWWKNRKIK